MFIWGRRCQTSTAKCFPNGDDGARVHAVTDGTQTLKEAVDAAFGAWMADLDAFYVLGSAVGPHPYPTIVHEFQKIISLESRRQILEKEGRLSDYVIACVGGGSNVIGAFSQYLPDESVKLIGVEAAGKGVDTELHAATMTKGTAGVVDGMRTIHSLMKMVELHLFIPFQQVWIIQALDQNMPTIRKLVVLIMSQQQMMRLLMPF